MLITLEQLEQCIPGSSDRCRVSSVKTLNELMGLYRITTDERKAAFIAQLTYDSENLHIMPDLAEYMSRWGVEHCNELADVGSFTAIVQHMHANIEGTECRKANYARCKKVFNLM